MSSARYTPIHNRKNDPEAAVEGAGSDVEDGESVKSITRQTFWVGFSERARKLWPQEKEYPVLGIVLGTFFFLSVLVLLYFGVRRGAPSIQSSAGGIIDVTQPGNPLVDGPTPHKRITYRPFQEDKFWVIGHRGDAGEFPEHSSLSYLAAINHGADFIECCDVVLTKDLVPVCRHEPNLSNTTNADELFPDQIKNYTIDGSVSTGVHAIDLTFEQVKKLRVRERLYFRTQVYNDRYPVLTFEECATLAKAAPRVVGIYPETKHPTWHDALLQSRGQNTTITDQVLRVAQQLGYDNAINTPQWRAQPIFLQSFEVTNLKYAHQVSPIPIIQLTDGLSVPLPDGSWTSYSEILNTDAGMAATAQYANGIGPDKVTLLQHMNGQGVRLPPSSGGVVERAHKYKLMVHLYTLRNEVEQGFPYPFSSVSEEYAFYFQSLGVDGGFTDFSGTLVPWRENLTDYEWDATWRKQPDPRPPHPGRKL